MLLKGEYVITREGKNVFILGAGEGLLSFACDEFLENVLTEDMKVEGKGVRFYFMDGETYELVPIDKSALDDSFSFVKENDVCTIMSYKGNVFGVEVPNFADLIVTSTEPGFAGNTATNTLKPATLETGAEVKVPLFINEGDKIQIDTRTGEYLGRSKA
jgi:elongation factor P